MNKIIYIWRTQIATNMGKSYHYITLLVTLLITASFTNLSDKNSAPYVLDVASVEADSVVLRLYNNTSRPAYLFDSYLNAYDIAYVSYIHRYNKADNVVKVSFLPFQQYLSESELRDHIFAGEKRYLSSDQIRYQFTKVDAGDSLDIVISKKTLTSERYYSDVNLKEYTHLEKARPGKKAKFKKLLKLKELKEKPVFDEEVIELAIYPDIEFFSKKGGYFLREVDNAASAYDIVTCTLKLSDIMPTSTSAP